MDATAATPRRRDVHPTRSPRPFQSLLGMMDGGSGNPIKCKENPRRSVAASHCMSSASATHTKTASFTAPFRHTAFTVIWTATVVSNVGGWMYSAASGWLMTSLDPDPLIVALVQAASSLPICLFAMPAGALADIFDKRKYLIVVETLTTVVSAIYAVMVGLG